MWQSCELNNTVLYIQLQSDTTGHWTKVMNEKVEEGDRKRSKTADKTPREKCTANALIIEHLDMLTQDFMNGSIFWEFLPGVPAKFSRNIC